MKKNRVVKLFEQFEQFLNEAMHVDAKGELVEELPEELPQFIKDAYADLKKKEKDLSWWDGHTLYDPEDSTKKRHIFVIEYNMSVTQKGQLLVYDFDKKTCDNVWPNSTDSDLAREAWEINVGTNKDRLEFFKKIRAGLSNKVTENESGEKKYLVGKPEVDVIGRFNKKKYTYKTATIKNDGTVVYGQVSFNVQGSAPKGETEWGTIISTKDFEDLLKSLKDVNEWSIVPGLDGAKHKAGDEFVVVKGYNNRPFSLTFGSYVDSRTGGNPGSSGAIEPGEIISFEEEAPNGNVWFNYKGKRGKTESGSLLNMLKAGVIKAK